MTAVLSAPSDESDWVHFNDAAAELDVSVQTLRRYAREGKLLRLYHGSRAYTTRTSIEQYKAREAQRAEARRVALERAANKKRR